MPVRGGGCENVLWGISLLITFMIILTILFAFTLVKIFCQYIKLLGKIAQMYKVKKICLLSLQ